MSSDVITLDPDDWVGEIEFRHYPVDNDGIQDCAWCGRMFPCDTALLVEEVRRLRGQEARAR